MDIEIALPGKMSESGSSLLKLIQNNSTPTIDLLVRESIQNSLDAYDENSENKFVEVQFNIGEFESYNLCKQLKGITANLKHKFPNSTYKYLSIRDLHTVGLTGELKYDNVKNNEYGNLIKLVYEISKPQQNEGAGGFWGLGKTIYFRVGIGLVLYYSRIKNTNGKYESRLAATLIEDENSNDSMIPLYQNKNKRGIAWWGEKIAENTTCPITDENEIRAILDIFNIPTYVSDETGTTVIIPYIDEQQLVKSNQIEYDDINRYWLKDLESYFKIAIQKWYAPRLNNSKYEYGKFLRVKINGKCIKNDGMEPVFRIVQSLYKQATTGEKAEYFIDNNIESYVEDINLRGLNKGQMAGRIAYVKVNKKQLWMVQPENKPSPYMYLNLPLTSNERNKPIICFTRKPGMIVSYEQMGPWVDGIPSVDGDEFIIGVFKLNSKNEYKLKNTKKLLLEEYARRSENADHISWCDYSIDNDNVNIVFKIQKQVKTKISKRFLENESQNVETFNSGLGKLLGDTLLPPEDFGKKPSSKKSKNGGGSGKQIQNHKKATFTVNGAAVKYLKNGMQIPMSLKTKSGFSTGTIEMSIDSSIKTITIPEWEESLNKSSYSMQNVQIIVDKVDNTENRSKLVLNEKNRNKSNEFLNAKLVFTKKNTGYIVEIDCLKKCKLEMSIYLDINVNGKNLKPEFTFKEKRGD